MNQTYFKRVSSCTPTELWVNNVTREEAQKGIECGAVGCTQNPAFTWRILSHPEEGIFAKKILDEILAMEKDDEKALTILQRELIKNICKYFMPIYEKSGRTQGWVSIQGDPFKEDASHIIEFARFNREASPNIIAKIPVTKDGLEAMQTLIKERIPILATEVMAIDQALDLCELYKDVTSGMDDPAPMYMAHIAGIFDEHLQDAVSKRNIDVSEDALYQAGIAVAKKIYQIMECKSYNVQFLSGGARGIHHFTEMVGARASVTINWGGTADKIIEVNPPVIQRFMNPTPFVVTDELLEKVEDFRKAYIPKSLKPEEYENFGPVVRFRNSFENGWKKCLEYIKERRPQL